MAKGFKRGSGGFKEEIKDLDFAVVAYPSEVELNTATPEDKTIGIVTSVPITSWHFGAEEPNVYNIKAHPQNSWVLLAPHKLSAGEILNFTLPVTVSSAYETIRLLDPHTGKAYCMRELDGTAPGGWPGAGTKLSVRISDDAHLINGWGADGTAYLIRWNSYFHEEGTVWIATGTSSPVAFNVLWKNGITVYPISAKQYISGALVDVIAKSYQNGAWGEWIRYLYNRGDMCADLTGGWSQSYGACNWVNNSDGYEINANGNGGQIATVNKIDLTDIKKLYFVGYCTNVYAATVQTLTMGILSDRAKTLWDYAVASVTAKTSSNTEQVYELDVSNITGSYYIAASYSLQSGVSGKCKLCEVRY